MWEILDEFCGTPFWDYNLTWNTTNPDLTPCLEATLLTWIPCSFLWLFAPLEIYFQKKSNSKSLPWTGANISRMLVALSLSLLCATNIMDAWFNKRSEKMFNADVTAWSLKAITFIFCVILMMVNKKKGRHTSGILFLFWFCITVCEIFIYRSAFLKLQRETHIPDEIPFVTEMIYFPLLVTELLLSCMADIRRRHPLLIIQKGLKECPEQGASFPSRLFFWWFNDMSILGWRRPITQEDLWQLNPDDRTEYISAQFERHYSPSHQLVTPIRLETDGTTPFQESNDKKHEETEFIVRNGRQNQQKKKKIRIVRMLCKTFWAYFVTGSVCKLVYDVCQFINPVILRLIIDYVSSSEPIWKGAVYASLMFINGSFQSVILADYFHRMFVMGMRVRTALVAAIYKKSLVLSPGAKRESTLGEIVNLMSVDSQRFMDLMVYLNMIWSAPLQILVALLMLWEELGPSVLAGLFVMIILIPLNALIANLAKKQQVKQMKNKDERVKLINEVLSGIKVLKLYAWEEAFREKVEEIRNRELRQLRKIAYLNSVSMVVWNCSPFLVALASFATFVLVDESNVLDAKRAFVSLSLFNILRFPLTMLPHLITTLVMVNVSVKRIDKYMNSEELVQYVIQDASQAHPIVVRNGDFSWSKSKAEKKSKENVPNLRNLNFNVERGALVAIVGQVGSGKSSLLSAILGEMEKVRGTVSLNGMTALVSQQPWIQNDSLKNNILFSKPFDKELYDEVVDACGLTPDLAILPGGDGTEIGEKGINLSGGQKQRVSLARAVYSFADIYLLDDPLSAVDSHVGKHIFEKVIGPTGILKNKTRILVTHGLTYLPQTDVIYVMKDGMIAERGSYQELVDSKGPFAEFLSQYLSQVESIEDDLEVLEELSHKNPELLRSLSERSSVGEDSDQCSDLETSRKLSLLSINRPPRRRSSSPVTSNSVEKLSSPKKDDGTKLILVEAAETGQVKWSVYLRYLNAVGLPWVIMIFFTYTLWQALSVGSNVWLSEWANDKHNPNSSLAERDLRLGVYGGLGLGQGLAVLVGSYACAYGTLAASSVIHKDLLKNVLRSPMSFFDTTPLGRIVNRFAKDIDTVDVTIPLTIRSWLSCVLQVISTLIVISIQTPIFLAITLPVGVIYYMIQRFYVSTSRQLKRLESITKSPIYSHFSETLAGSTTIRAYGAEQRFCMQSNTFVDNNQICYYPSIVANRWLSIRLDFCGNCIILFAALFAVLQRDNLDAGKIGLSVSYALMVTQTLNWMVRMSSELETNIVAVERVLEYTKTPTEAEWVNDKNRPSKDWPPTGEAQMDDYSTRYREGLELVLKDISCDIKAGEKVGIVGRTGAGKSSLTLSLFRIIEAAGGSITIDGINIAGLGLHDLRSKITIIPQDPVLFSGTLKMNLDPFSWYTDSQLWEALDHAHLKSFVSSLVSGLDHEVVEGGENLSVGQRQLVCLARALLRKTKILVLDEATAAVDLETDDLIQATIRREFADATVLTIAHRLNTVMDYDRIMVLDKGQVAEFDSPDALLKNKKSIFYGMAKDAGLV